MKKKGRETFNNFKRSLKNEQVQKIKSQIRMELTGQNYCTQSSQSISRSSSFPKRSKTLYKYLYKDNESFQNQNQDAKSKYQVLKVDEILQKQQINRAFNYLFQQFETNEYSIVARSIELRTKNYKKILQSYQLEQISICYIVQKKLLDWNLIISSWYWAKWAQNYCFLQILNSLLGNLFWEVYKFHMQEQITNYQAFLMKEVEVNYHSLKKNQQQIAYLQNFQVWDIIIEGILSKSYLKKTQFQAYQKKFTNSLTQYLLKKLQAYQEIYLKYESLKQTSQISNIKQIQVLLKLEKSNFHEIIYNDNMELLIQEFLFDLMTKIQEDNRKDLARTQNQIESQCKKLRVVSLYICTRMAIDDDYESKKEILQQNYKENQILSLIEYLNYKLTTFKNSQATICQANQMNQVIRCSGLIWQFDQTDNFLDYVKSLLNQFVLFLNTTGSNLYSQNFYRFIMMHNNLIKIIVNIQTSLLVKFQRQQEQSQYPVPIQYFSYFDNLFRFIIVHKLGSLGNQTQNLDQNVGWEIEYNLLQLLEVHLRQINCNIIHPNFDYKLFQQAIQHYRLYFKTINVNKSIAIESQTKLILQYFFLLLKQYYWENGHASIKNPQLQI